MRLSARNQLKGTVTKVTKGATTSHVVVDIVHVISLKEPLPK